MFSTPLSDSFTCHTCGKLGWEQQNCSPTASSVCHLAFIVVFNYVTHRSINNVMCWPHRVGVSVCHVAFIVIVK